MPYIIFQIMIIFCFTFTFHILKSKKFMSCKVFPCINYLPCCCCHPGNFILQSVWYGSLAEDLVPWKSCNDRATDQYFYFFKNNFLKVLMYAPPPPHLCFPNFYFIIHIFLNIECVRSLRTVASWPWQGSVVIKCMTICQCSFAFSLSRCEYQVLSCE